MDPGCFKRKREPESEDQNEPRKVLVVEGANEDVQSNSIPRSTSSSSQSGWDYDVFLSFRGEDTRKNFTDHLYSALKRVGIHTFRDDEGLDRGEIISSQLLNAIRRSRIFIVVFSKGYASSRWCLDELAEIVNCKNTIGHTLLPVFYDVDPSDVRKQTKTFAEAFIRHEKRFHTDMKRVQRWREALTEAAECAGWNLGNGHESQFIGKIVKQVLCKVNIAHLDVAIHPIGMHSRVEHIKALLNLETNDVRIMGFYGMGGIGKTTLAKAVYNEICHGFQGSSFLFNVKEKSKEFNGLIHLQKQLLYDILHKKNWNVSNVARGITLIKERVQGKKVLVVLDDVDHLDQLHALGGLNFKLFGLGSRLIVTTRDKQLLDLLKADEKYKVIELNHCESLQLFKLHALPMTHPIKEHLELSVSVVQYTGGLPLALVVLGSSLCGKSVVEWISKLEKLQKILDGEIKKKLETSLDSLEYETMVIFLDIACFFIGMEKEYVMQILLACDFYAESGLGILIQRSLVTIEDNKLRMHDLIRDMGRGIVYAESPLNPGRRSRLWFHKDIANVLRNNTGSKKVEGLILNLPEHEDVDWESKAFKKMKNLRLLQINDVHPKGSYEHLFKAQKSLKWLCWHKCTLKSLPHDFHLENLVILDMQRSKVKQVWKTKKIFNKLKVLNLSNSKSLIRSPNFSQVPQLETLILNGCTRLKDLSNFSKTPHLKSINLEGCTSLVKIHKSIGCQTGLVLLNLQGCKNLRNLPSSISNLKYLKTLVLTKCFSLTKVPKQLGNLMAITELCMENTAIERLPSSFHHLCNLKSLSFRGCERLIESPKFVRTSCLMSLNLSGCTRLVEIDESVGFLKRLFRLNLERCKKLKNLPSSIFNLKSLEVLILRKCYKFDKLPEELGNMTALSILILEYTAIKQLPSSFKLLRNLAYLSCCGCEYLIKSPELLETSVMQMMTFEDCTSLVEIHASIGHLKRLIALDLTGCKKLRCLPSSIYNLKRCSLELSNCPEPDKLPEQCGNMKDLKEFVANRIAVDPYYYFGDFSNLVFEILPRCGGASPSRISPNSSNRMSLVPISKLRSLIQLDLSNRNLSENEFRNEFECLTSLQMLKLSRNNFRNPPSFISCLPNLLTLDVSECTSLQSIALPGSVVELTANGCTSLERISILTNESSRSADIIKSTSMEKLNLIRKNRSRGRPNFFLNNCCKLVEIQNLERLQRPPFTFQMGNCNNLSLESINSVVQVMCLRHDSGYRYDSGCIYGVLPGSEIPNWISHQAMGSSVSFRVPPFLFGSKVSKVLLSIVYATNKESPALGDGRFSWRLYNRSFRDESNHRCWVGSCNAITSVLDYDVFEDHILTRVMEWHVFLRHLLNFKMKCGDEIEVVICPQLVEVKRCGIHFVLDGDEPSVRDGDEISEIESEEDSRL
ncbi:disease resistance protein RPV1-like [Corylus avellana]|uniref:disease resistance protein RPV1-like n=1 Tax=Corylus avellana TaxID=13451 RepID=UPI00286B2FB9|nr:disease resistance protein RPV1-like [Corylus avellana]XP_059430131.1 disease resistance protein RPV1-like [Corylus avellana]XP_059430132.1 disease resistance protein RPV1-like [Corylus avellana]XP_059430133.1 disease resistance protein RPV1-like [Corylus avellana]XP_059430134.1 disease resistance protein RPV1-like [Corylus avellana]